MTQPRFFASIRALTLMSIILVPTAATVNSHRDTITASVPPPNSTKGYLAPSQQPTVLFTPNLGQWPDAVRYQMRGAGGTWWFTEREIWLTVTKDEGRRTKDG